MTISANDIRVRSAILTYPVVAKLAKAKEATLRSWARSRGRRPAIIHTARPLKRGFPTVPLIGLAEAHTLRALRKGGLSMSEIKLAADYIRDETGDFYALANPKLVTDGATAFVQHDDGLHRIRDKQAAFTDVLRDHLKPLILGEDDYVEQFEVAPGITIDPRFNSGRPAFTRTRIPVFAVLGSLLAGETEDEVADDYGLEPTEVRQVWDSKDYFAAVA